MPIAINGSGTITGVSVGGLPDGIVDTDTLTSSVNIIREIDQWRITSNLATTSGGGAVGLTANWERADSSGAGYIGTGMSQSSGVFTFPSTGMWQIDFRGVGKKSSITSKYIAAQIQTTVDDSSYSTLSQAYTFIENNGGGCWFGLSAIGVFDVTNTSNCKVKFNVSADQVIEFYGDSNSNQTYVIFTRLGDT